MEYENKDSNYEELMRVKAELEAAAPDVEREVEALERTKWVGQETLKLEFVI